CARWVLPRAHLHTSSARSQTLTRSDRCGLTVHEHSALALPRRCLGIAIIELLAGLRNRVQPISSNPILRILVVAVPGLLVAIVLGSQVGAGSWLLPVSLAAACILFALYILFFRAVTLDALTLGFLLLGYIVGNRGFAALHVGGRTPIYVGEIGLTVCAAILGVRFALRKTKLLL